MSSLEASLARTCRAWAHAPGLPENVPGSSGKSAASSRKFGPSGWCLKTSWGCSLAMVGKTLQKSSKPLPSAGMWDAGGCLMLSISESPSDAGVFSWSQVLDDSPPLGCFLMPRHWTQYLARLARSKSHGVCLLSTGQERAQHPAYRCGDSYLSEGGWRAMAERTRIAQAAGISAGLDATDHVEARAAGNAVCVPVARWVGQHLMAAFDL